MKRAKKSAINKNSITQWVNTLADRVRCLTEEIMTLDEKERQECEVYTRVMGYFRPVSQFNKGKQSEFNERKWFSENRLKSQQHQKASDSQCDICSLQ